LLVEVRSVWVETFRTRILALGKAAPDGSVTVPESDDVSDWALVKTEKQSAHAMTRHDARREIGFALLKTASSKFFLFQTDPGEEDLCIFIYFQFGFTSRLACSI